MKSLKEYLNTSFIIEHIEEIDAEIVCEALSDPKLIKLAKQLRSFGSKNKGTWGNKSFSGIFGRYAIEWDKIKEEDWEHYEAGDPRAKKTLRKYIQKRSNGPDGIALLATKDLEFKYLIGFAKVIDFQKKTYYNSDEVKPDYLDLPKQSDVLALLDTKDKDGEPKYDVYVLDFEGKLKDVYDKRYQRSLAKDGVVLQGDAEYYKNLAKKNVERYKKMIAQMKAEKAAKEDTLVQDVHAVLKELMDLSADVSSNPAKYADVVYYVSSVIASTYGTSKSGANIMTCLGEYLKSYTKIASGKGDEYERDENAKYRARLKDQMEGIKRQIAQIKEKIA